MKVKKLNETGFITDFLVFLPTLGIIMKNFNTKNTATLGIIALTSHTIIAIFMCFFYLVSSLFGKPWYFLQNSAVWVVLFMLTEVSIILYAWYSIQEKSTRTWVERVALLISTSSSVIYLILDFASNSPQNVDAPNCIWGIVWAVISFMGIFPALKRKYLNNELF